MARARTAPAAAEAPEAAVDAFLERVRSTPRSGRGRLIFAMDATASRQPTWDLAMETQAAMFATATGIGDLAVQLVFYRGIGECKAGPFVTRPDDMIRRMTSVGCRAGRTQIARVLRHALSVHETAPVSALVFIGDCVEEEPDGLYGLAGEMGLRKLPAFIFHEGHEPQAERVLTHVARLSGGACCKFDARGPDELRRLLGAVAVYAAGGRVALEDHARKAGGAVLRLTHQMGGDPGTGAGGDGDR
nr:VWA domain-containing protein [Roseospira goensis]